MPAEPISGRAAYQKYIDHTLPILEATGGGIAFLGVGGSYLIGPEDECWDIAMLVRQKSLTDFMSFATHQEYLAGFGHRTAALQDSRLLPLVELKSGNLTSGSRHKDGGFRPAQ